MTLAHSRSSSSTSMSRFPAGEVSRLASARHFIPLEDRGDVDLEPELLADQPSPLHDLVPGHAERLTLELPCRAEPDPRVPPGVDRRPFVLDFELDLPGHVQDREVPGHAEARSFPEPDPSAAEGERGEPL